MVVDKYKKIVIISNLALLRLMLLPMLLKAITVENSRAHPFLDLLLLSIFW